MSISKLRRPSLPSDIDSDLSIAVVDNNIKSIISESDIPVKESYVFNGVHERTAKGDNLLVSTSTSVNRHQLKYSLKRDSLYHILPEYLFHPLDRYADTDGNKEEFIKRRKAQKDIEADALEYFYPFDKKFQVLRTSFQQKLNNEILNNKLFIVDFITEGYDINKNNPFIKGAYPCIIWLRNNRGVKQLLELAVKYAFSNSLNSYNIVFMEQSSEIDAHSCHITLEGEIDDLFCAPLYYYLEESINIEYQTEITSENQIEQLKSEIEEFESFFTKWFLTQNQTIKVRFGDYNKQPIMNVGTSNDDLFLGYNTQLI